MSSKDRLESREDDGLAIAEIGAWGEDKYRLVAYYASLFLTSIRSQWDALIYLDLFSGSGYSKIRGTNRIVSASPLVVLELPEHFDRYIFCDENKENAEALKSRCARLFPEREVTVLPRDANISVSDILMAMPQPRKNYKVLGFCFLDPFQMQNLRFSTINDLSKRFMDFLVLIPSGMDANRNEQNYLREDNSTLDDFLGTNNWRIRWAQEKSNGKSFEHFVVEEFGHSIGTYWLYRPGYRERSPRSF